MVYMNNDISHFDIHGHINFPEYDADREAVIERARSAQIGMITVGVDLASSRSAVALAEATEGVWAIVGLHPTDSKEDFDYDAFKALAMHPKVVAIGETGFDYFHGDPAEFARQRDIFERQIALANEINKPLMLHVRNGKNGGNAYADALAILKEKARVPFSFHFFAGTEADMNAIFDAGGYVSFTGVLTFARNYDVLIKSARLDRVMTETDCPFVAPAPYRGKRNEPSYVIEVVRAIARIRAEEEGQVAARLRHNVRDFFGL